MPSLQFELPSDKDQITILRGIAIILIIFGLDSLYSTIDSGFHTKDLGVFMIPVGIGLLRRKDSSRAWARFWLFLCFLSLCFTLGIVLFLSPLVQNASSHSIPRALISFALVTAIGLVVAAVLWLSPRHLKPINPADNLDTQPPKNKNG